MMDKRTLNEDVNQARVTLQLSPLNEAINVRHQCLNEKKIKRNN